MWHAGWEPVLLCLQTAACEVLKTEKLEHIQFIFVCCFDLGKPALGNHIQQHFFSCGLWSILKQTGHIFSVILQSIHRITFSLQLVNFVSGKQR